MALIGYLYDQIKTACAYLDPADEYIKLRILVNQVDSLLSPAQKDCLLKLAAEHIGGEETATGKRLACEELVLALTWATNKDGIEMEGDVLWIWADNSLRFQAHVAERDVSWILADDQIEFQALVDTGDTAFVCKCDESKAGNFCRHHMVLDLALALVGSEAGKSAAEPPAA